MSYVKRLWRGEIPLAVTFWVYGVLVIIVLSIPSYIMSQYNDSILELGGYYNGFDIVFLFIFLIYTILFLTFDIFILIAIWRSASLYEGPGAYAFLAKAMVVLALLNGGLELMNLLQST